MSKSPLITRFAIPAKCEMEQQGRTVEDELPAVLEYAGGITRVAKSKLTEVNNETTDDR